MNETSGNPNDSGSEDTTVNDVVYGEQPPEKKSKKKIIIIFSIVALLLIGIIAFLIIRASTNPDVSRDANGAFFGTVTSVRPDSIRVDTEDGKSVRVDTWKVCGDNTRQNINVGDRLRIYADRELFDYDAWRITREDGTPACPAAETETTTTTTEPTETTQATTTTPSGSGEFVGTVSRVWEDGFRLRVDNADSIDVDSWDVCGDDTQSHISVNDRVRVTAERSGSEYDATRITTENGEPLCVGATPGDD